MSRRASLWDDEAEIWGSSEGGQRKLGLLFMARQARQSVEWIGDERRSAARAMTGKVWSAKDALAWLCAVNLVLFPAVCGRRRGFSGSERSLRPGWVSSVWMQMPYLCSLVPSPFSFFFSFCWLLRGEGRRGVFLLTKMMQPSLSHTPVHHPVALCRSLLLDTLSSLAFNLNTKLLKPRVYTVDSPEEAKTLPTESSSRLTKRAAGLATARTNPK